MKTKDPSEYNESEKKIAELAAEGGNRAVFFKDEEDVSVPIQGLEGPEEITFSGVGKFMIFGSPEYVGTIPVRDFEYSIDGRMLNRVTGEEIPPEKMNDYQKKDFSFMSLIIGWEVKTDVGEMNGNCPCL